MIEKEKEKLNDPELTFQPIINNNYNYGFFYLKNKNNFKKN